VKGLIMNFKQNIKRTPIPPLETSIQKEIQTQTIETF
jgi:hypothetical protein